MHEIFKISDIVHQILIDDKRARNSDNYLYLQVCLTIAKRTGINLYSITMTDFLINRKEYHMPGFETVRRSRQKIQHDHPELSACDDVEAERMINEGEFKAYSRKVGV